MAPFGIKVKYCFSKPSFFIFGRFNRCKIKCNFNQFIQIWRITIKYWHSQYITIGILYLIMYVSLMPCLRLGSPLVKVIFRILARWKADTAALSQAGCTRNSSAASRSWSSPAAAIPLPRQRASSTLSRLSARRRSLSCSSCAIWPTRVLNKKPPAWLS